MIFVTRHPDLSIALVAAALATVALVSEAVLWVRRRRAADAAIRRRLTFR